MSKRLHMFQLSPVFPRCICSLRSFWLEVPQSSAAYIESELQESMKVRGLQSEEIDRRKKGVFIVSLC